MLLLFGVVAFLRCWLVFHWCDTCVVFIKRGPHLLARSPSACVCCVLVVGWVVLRCDAGNGERSPLITVTSMHLAYERRAKGSPATEKKHKNKNNQNQKLICQSEGFTGAGRGRRGNHQTCGQSIILASSRRRDVGVVAAVALCGRAPDLFARLHQLLDDV